MISLRKLMGKDDRFFSMLDEAAAEARHSVEALSNCLAKPDQVPQLDEFVQSRRQEKKIARQISEFLATTFVTQLEREDIEMLADNLYKIPKTVEKFAERFIIAADTVRSTRPDFTRHIALLENATQLVVKMVAELPDVGAGRLDKIKGMNSRLQEVEGQADELILERLRDLWSGRYETIVVIMMKDLYELLEKVIDRCRDVGKAVTHIVLKNS